MIKAEGTEQEFEKLAEEIEYLYSSTELSVQESVIEILKINGIIPQAIWKQEYDKWFNNKNLDLSESNRLIIILKEHILDLEKKLKGK